MNKFKIGDIVIVKDDRRDFIKHIYSDPSLFTQAKRKLGLAAANGAELLIVDFFNDDPNNLVLGNEEITQKATLTLDAHDFEPAEEEIDVSEFFE